MAQLIENAPGGCKITFKADKSGLISINVVSSRGEALGSAYNSKGNTSLVVNGMVSQLERETVAISNDMSQLEAQLLNQKAIVANANSTPAQKQEANTKIAQIEAELRDLNSLLLSVENARSSIQSQGNSILTELLTEAAEEPITEPSPNPPSTTITNTTTTTGGTTTTANTNTLQGPASDDAGTGQTTNTTTTTPGTQTPNVDAGNNTSNQDPAVTGVDNNAPTDPASEREGEDDGSTQGDPPYENETFLRTGEGTGSLSKPGKRLSNPLSYLASYTYQLSLYMISPDAYDAFVAGGKRDINLYNEQIATSDAALDAAEQGRSGGAFLIAQSGGIGADDIRAEGFDMDYYIDNLSFKHFCSPKETSGPLGNVEFKFQIVEPYGFSFITKLRDAQDKLIKNAGGKSSVKSAPTKQFFILGIRFFGYDQSGRPVTGSEILDGEPLDPNAIGNGGIFQTFYDVVITKVKFKIDGRATVYDIEAASVGSNLGVNIKKGYINSDIEAYGSTVRDMLCGEKGLITILNKEQKDLVKNKTVKYPTVYKIKWIGDAEQIAVSSVISEAKQDKSKQAGSTAEDTTQVNDATDTKAAPNKNKQKMSFSNRPIIQALDQVIARSKYLEDSMEFNYTDNKENNPKTSGPDVVKTPNKKLTWFHINPVISEIKWDEKIKDWAYTITYEIQTYLIPAIDNPYVGKKTKYYGPHKRYRYWYSGENSEILGYEQRLDNAYFSVVVAGDPKKDSGNDNQESGPSSTSTAPNMQSGGDKENDGGTLSGAAVNSVRTNLYDPNGLARAKVQILGDPDYLMQEVASGTTGINQAYNRFYKDSSFTINPSGGQVFFEIDFKEAVDYSLSTVDITFDDGRGITGQGGTLSINDSILFWKYPDEIKDIVDGVVYNLVTVTSSFRGGSFTQTLDAFVETFSDESSLTEEEKTQLDEETNGSGKSTNSENIADGGAEDPAFDANANPGQSANPSPAPQPNT